MCYVMDLAMQEAADWERDHPGPPPSRGEIVMRWVDLVCIITLLTCPIWL